MSRNGKRRALVCLYGVGGITMILVLVPLLGVWLAVPAGAAAFALFLAMPYYSDWK